jgi:L-lactate permease
VIAGVVFGVAYLAAFSIRGKYLPGLVGAILGGLLLYLVLKEADARKQRRWEEQRGASPDPRP